MKEAEPEGGLESYPPQNNTTLQKIFKIRRFSFWGFHRKHVGSLVATFHLFRRKKTVNKDLKGLTGRIYSSVILLRYQQTGFRGCEKVQSVRQERNKKAGDFPRQQEDRARPRQNVNAAEWEVEIVLLEIIQNYWSSRSEKVSLTWPYLNFREKWVRERKGLIVCWCVLKTIRHPVMALRRWSGKRGVVWKTDIPRLRVCN